MQEQKKQRQWQPWLSSAAVRASVFVRWPGSHNFGFNADLVGQASSKCNLHVSLCVCKRSKHLLVQPLSNSCMVRSCLTLRMYGSAMNAHPEYAVWRDEEQRVCEYEGHESCRTNSSKRIICLQRSEAYSSRQARYLHRRKKNLTQDNAMCIVEQRCEAATVTVESKSSKREKPRLAW